MKRRRVLTCIVPLMAAAGVPAIAAAQDRSAGSRTTTVQIEASPVDAGRNHGGKAYLDNMPAPQPRPELMNVPDQVSRDTNKTTPQITGAGQGGPGMAQLTRAQLDASLAQLTAAERQVLLQAIAGTDICDNPPDVPALVALCRTRLETRSSEFASNLPDVSAEERLIRFDLDNAALPSVSQVIDRLARGSTATDDLSNQAIASIALGSSNPAASRPNEEPEPAALDQETQALINALINQLGGNPP